MIGDLLDLRAFCLVVDRGSITAAAKAMGEAKGSVSRRMSRLEREVGVELLRRSPRLVQPTEQGAAFRLRIGRALEMVDDATAELQETRRVPAGHLRVTAPFDLALTSFAPIVAGFVERYPAITVEMLITDARLDFDSHQIDIALRAAVTLQDSTLIAHKLADLAMGMFAAPSYLAKHGTPQTPASLRDHRLVLFGATRGTGTVVFDDEKKKKASFRLPAVIGTTDFAFCREVARIGAGVAMLPVLIASRDVRDGTLVRVLEKHSLKGAVLYLVHPGTRLLSPKVRAFRDYMLESFRAR